RALLHLGMLDGEYVPPPRPALYREFRWLRTPTGGFFRKTVSAGDLVHSGRSIGSLVDLWGEPIDDISSPVDGVVLFITTSPAMAEDGLIAGIGVG
ncbi:MAG: succinylglutamate desuccinylase/aspartoacylase family protein, partial [Chloroflexota bacterium]